MNRYAIENLFGIEGLNIAWYGLIIACGMVLGFALAIYRCRKTGINKEHIYNLALWLIPVCIICARAYYVIFEWDNYKNDLLSVFEINRGGLAIYGGVLGGVAVALIYCKVKRTSKPLHTVVGTNGYQLWITTAYYPSSEKWLDDLKTQREECTIIELMIIE